MKASTPLESMRPLSLAQDFDKGGKMLEKVSRDAAHTQVGPIPLPVQEDNILGDGVPVGVQENPLDPGRVVDETHNHLVKSNTNDVARTDASAHDRAPNEEEWNRHVEEVWLHRPSVLPAQCLQTNLNALSNILSGVDFPEQKEAMRLVGSLQSLTGLFVREEEYKLGLLRAQE
ncbi:MAG: hypothetical protein Q8O14_00900 [bacterium]|nr:hypothetical protein [bacterium]